MKLCYQRIKIQNYYILLIKITHHKWKFLSLSINTLSVVDSILYDISATIIQSSLAENLRDKLANTAADSKAPQSCTQLGEVYEMGA